jgi:hypothetical protein
VAQRGRMDAVLLVQRIHARHTRSKKGTKSAPFARATVG